MKKIHIKQSSKKIIKYIFTSLVILSLGIWIYSKITFKSQIAQVTSGGTEACISNVTSFSAKGFCGTPGNPDSFQSFSYTCSNRNSADYQLGGGKCTSFAQAYGEITKLCGQTCPTPKPTCTPRDPCDDPNNDNPPVECALMGVRAPLPSGGWYCPASPKPTPTPPSQPPAGCYEEKVQCVKAPCPSIIICPSPKPTPKPPAGCYYEQSRCEIDARGVERCLGSATLVCPPSPKPNPRVCTQDTGMCMSKKNQRSKDYISTGCISYKDGCEKTDLCASPFKLCDELATAKPDPRICTQVVGYCMSKPTGGTTGTCISYKNGCEQSDLCASPTKVCTIRDLANSTDSNVIFILNKFFAWFLNQLK